MRLLVVDDHAELRAGVRSLLAQDHIQISEADTADAADTLARTQKFSAIVLDLGLPDGDGLTLLRQWRKRGISTPVLVLSARGAPDERADGMEAGADDYLAKPYHARELVARLQRLLSGNRGTVVQLGDGGQVALDLSTGAVSIGGASVSLSATLRRALSALVAARGPLSKDALLDLAGDALEPATENAVEQWVRRLRSKLGNDVIVTEPGLGYRVNRHDS
ncbi:response regulator transcription factor [bacterium]|nr:response regulator transcription factor [bacterium]